MAPADPRRGLAAHVEPGAAVAYDRGERPLVDAERGDGLVDVRVLEDVQQRLLEEAVDA